MYASARLLPTLLLLGAAAAIPAPQPTPPPVLAVRDDATNLDPWVTVNESGQPKTITPVLTTISGTPTVISPAPYVLTGSVFTQTYYGEVKTTTGPAPVPTATNTQGAGVFDVCKNQNGDFKPFCMPSNNATLYPGSVYYVTWDPTYFPGTNATIKVIGFVYNSTSGIVTSDEAFSSSNMAAGWGFYQWSLDSSVLTTRGTGALNVTIKIATNPAGWLTGPTVLITNPPIYHAPPTTPPTGMALYIGLPTIVGFAALVLIGTCIWNRKERHIGLGNIMNRGRAGYGVGKSRAQRLLGKRSRRNEDQGIRLMDRDINAAPGEVYRDQVAPPRREIDPIDVGIARRDSDALGSLAGTPTEDRQMELNRATKSNAFRDELSRQHRDRF